MNANLTHADILAVRDASRRMVRDLGFMRQTLADTDLSASAVHTIVELGRHGTLTANRLAQILLLEKSSVSRMLARLIERGLVQEATSDADGRSKLLSLTKQGNEMLAEIDRFANLKVGRALHALNGDARIRVVGGLTAYAEALAMARNGGTVEDRAELQIVEGYRSGAIGRIAEMHARYYGRLWGVNAFLEGRVANGVSEFSLRLDRPVNKLWLAVQGDEIVGSVAIDGEDLGEGKAHLRWFIIEDGLRGSGTGRKLLTKAIDFCDEQGFAETHLWTAKGLDVARRLYESFGFVQTKEWVGHQWGPELTEQTFVRRKGTQG
jgi:DNA-binding MarR family transcriptional regulator/N-acetylglutamate synthase-like GNAT family acetyltransferase